MRINILGSGYMGKQIASLLKVIGFDVLIWEKNDNDLENQLIKESVKIEKILKLKSEGSIKIEKNLSKFENFLTIETVKEDLSIKKNVFESLQYKENLFSNTSSIKLSKIGKNINGFHFMNPVTTKFIEVCKISNFSTKYLDELINKLKNLSYEIIDVQDTPGFIINKIIFNEISFFFYLIEEEKLNAKDVKKICSNEFKRNDPIKLVNIIGVDTCLYILKNLNEYDKNYYIPKIFEPSIKSNVLGYKNKKLLKIK